MLGVLLASFAKTMVNTHKYILTLLVSCCVCVHTCLYMYMERERPMHPSKHLTPKEGFAIPTRQGLSRNVPVAISQSVVNMSDT